MELSIIVAITANNAIGRNGDMLYHISEDLRHFKALTTGHTIIMGRRTYESLPKRPLPNRRNIVLSRNTDYNAPGAEVHPDLDTALRATNPDETETFIIGGGQIYAQALPSATRLYITHIDTTETDADTYFPAIDPHTWAIHDLGDWQTDPHTGLRYRYAQYRRKQPCL